MEELPIDEAHSKGESTWKITVKCNDGEYFIGGTVFYCNQKKILARTGKAITEAMFSDIGEIVTLADAYCTSSIDYSGKTYLVIHQADLQEIGCLSELEHLAGLIIVEESESRKSINRCPKSSSSMVELTIEELLGKTGLGLESIPSICISVDAKEGKALFDKCSSNKTDSTAWRENIMVGDDIDAVFWPTKTWARATVIDMGHKYVPARRFLRITYHGMEEKFDRWTCRWCPEIAPYASKCKSFSHVKMTQQGNAFINKWRNGLKKGSLLDAKDTMGNWYKSLVIDIKGDDIKLHYQGWKPRWDVWLSRFSSDIAHVCTRTRPWRAFKVGDIVDANPKSRDDHTAWTEGRIIKVDTVDVSIETRVDLQQNSMTQGKQKMLRAS